MEVARPSPDGHRAVADFIARLNVDPTHQIGYLGDNPDEIVESLTEESSVLDNSVVGRRDGELVGFLGFDADLDLDRAWIYGPLVSDSRWDETATRLWDELETLVSFPVTELEMFFNVANENAERFAQRHAFEHYKDVHVLRFGGSPLPEPPDGVEDIPDELHHQLVALHDSIFPKTYWSGKQIIERLNGTRRCLVVADKGKLLGYAYVEVDPRFGEGNIEFLGVAEASRGRGVGTKLISFAVAWMFSFENMKETWLVVDDDNVAARHLYKGLGWQPIHAMRSRRRSHRPLDG